MIMGLGFLTKTPFMLFFIFPPIAMLIFFFSLKLHYLVIFALTMIALLLSIAAYSLIKNNYAKFSIYYLLLGVIYFLTLGNIIITVILLSLIFLFGLPAGSVFAEQLFFRRKAAKKVKKR